MKVKAFTLIEVITAVFLTSFIVYSSYEGYLFLNKMFYNQQNEYENLTQNSEFNLTLKRDVFFAEKVYLLNENEIFMQDNKRGNVSYEFFNTEVIRKTDFNDEIFDLNIQSFILYNQEHKVAEIGDVIYHLQIQYLDIHNNALNLNFVKIYGVENQINQLLSVGP